MPDLMICTIICTLIAIPCLLIGYKDDLKWGPLGFIYRSFKYGKSPRGSRSSDHKIPAKLVGLKPNPDSFCQTAKFCTVLAEQCAKVVNGGDLVLNCSISKDGVFNISHFEEITDLAKSFFPSVEKNLVNTYNGKDTSLIDMTVADVIDTLHSFAPLGMVDGSAFPDGGAFYTVRWPSGKIYDISDLL